MLHILYFLIVRAESVEEYEGQGLDKDKVGANKSPLPQYDRNISKMGQQYVHNVSPFGVLPGIRGIHQH